MKSIKIGFFSDMHYKKGMYSATVGDLHAIMDRAHENNVDIVLHCGDLCNDYFGSPELMKAYLANRYGFPVYGLYGNHELESERNSMTLVTPLLTNRADAVIWGTEDGKIGDGSVGYYYFESNGFRIIMLDTNYSWNAEKEEWQHNTTASYGPPAGNTKINALSPTQFDWLKKLLYNAAEECIPCIVCSHAGFTADWPDHSYDCNEVVALFEEINQKQPGTVIAALNGHKHAHYCRVHNDIFYLNCNAVRNAHWQKEKVPHYENETFMQEIFDKNLDIVGTREISLSSLWMSQNTWYSNDPLNAILTISTDGTVTVDGCESGWWSDIAPDTDDERMPYIKSGTYNTK